MKLSLSESRRQVFSQRSPYDCKNLPTVPNISVHGFPARMFISIGCIREVRVHNLTVESRELEARINGLDEWQVKPVRKIFFISNAGYLFVRLI